MPSGRRIKAKLAGNGLSARHGRRVLMSSQGEIVKLSKEQKIELINHLSHPYGMVSLRCDGRLVTLQVQRWRALSYRVMTYVDGVFKYAWCRPTNNAPESKFLRKSVRSNVTAAKRKLAEKTWGKRAVKNDPFWSGSFTTYLPDWPNGKAAINHLCAACISIEIEASTVETRANTKTVSLGDGIVDEGVAIVPNETTSGVTNEPQF